MLETSKIKILIIKIVNNIQFKNYKYFIYHVFFACSKRKIPFPSTILRQYIRLKQKGSRKSAYSCGCDIAHSMEWPTFRIHC